MKLVLVSPPGPDARELDVVREAFAAGLPRYHLRKPGWSAAEVERWLDRLDDPERARVVVHAHHEVAARRGAGAHFGDCPSTPFEPPSGARPTSRACHDLAAVRAALGRYDAVLVSPLFASISKAGYGPAPAAFLADLARLLASRTGAQARTEVIGLGGVDAARLERCRALALDGVAVLGAVWTAPDPLDAVRGLLRACAALSTRPEAPAASTSLTP